MKPFVDPLLLLYPGVLAIFTMIMLLVLKNRIFRKTAAQEEAKIWFSPDPCGGEMAYESKEGNFKMEYELGRGSAIAVIHLPEQEYWQAQTGMPLERRAEVLNFIGQKALEKQANGQGTFTLEGNSMVIWGTQLLPKSNTANTRYIFKTIE